MTRKNQTTITAEPNKQELFITREFDAPRERVFRAYTDPELYVQWLGPHGYEMNLEIFEPHSGGRWRYTHADPDGGEHGFHGVFHEVLAPERIIQTFEYEGLPESGHVILETMWLEALPDGRTRITAQSVFQTVADRDGMIQSGMEQGVVEGFERLDAVLTELRNQAVTRHP
ncbi:MAG: SRPBCC family protein [Anaerolineales bacterium]|nr:SRPBCC family protein [Anaerolineales bacterium]